MPDLPVSFIAAAVLALASSASAQMPGPPPLPPTVLKDVPRVGYDIHLCPLPGSLYSLLDYIAEPCDYETIMGVTGACFRRIWNRDDGGNVDLMYLAPEPHRRILDALGYEYHTVARNRTEMLDAVKAAVANGRPLISFGIIGPPEAGLVTGYDVDGDALYGWSYFQENADQGYYRLEDWFETLDKTYPLGFLVVGDHIGPRPSDRDTLVSSLEWAIDLSRRADRGLADHVCGLAAYDAWADALEVDADYPADNAEIMSTRLMVQGDQTVMLYERAEAAKFLRRMAVAVPEVAGELTAAAGLYDQVSALGSQVYRWGDWSGPEARQGLADPATRREIAGHVRAARALEEQGVVLLEAALAKLRGDQQGLPPLTHVELQPSHLVNYPPEYRPNIEGMRVASALRATMEFAGQDLGFSVSDGWRTSEAFPFFMGTFGEAFEFCWFRKPGAPGGPEDPHDFGDLPGRLQTALAAAGFGCEVLQHPVGGGGPYQPREKLIASIADRGLPVLLLDVPERDWAFVATGYADVGETLVGWGVEGGDDRGIDFAPDKRLTVTDWADKASAIVFLTSRAAQPEQPPVYRAALEQAVRLLRETERGDDIMGPATFETCARLLRDPALDADDPATAKRRQDLLHPLIWDLATRRHYANLFLTTAAQQLPAAQSELQAAAACCRAEHDMMWQIMRIAGGEFPGGDLPGTIDPAIREQIAVVIEQARDKDLEAADLIEAALQLLVP